MNSRHPMKSIREFLQLHREVQDVEFGVYTHIKQCLRDTQRVHRCPAGELEETFSQLRSNLKAGEEIAFHSRLYLRGETYPIRHMVFVDFVPGELNDVLDGAREFLQERQRHGPVEIYHSESSYHLYGFQLVNHQEWTRIMGHLLLLNLPGKIRIVDDRWVGHRLMAGYSALRWSDNGKRSPQLVWTAAGHLSPVGARE